MSIPTVSSDDTASEEAPSADDGKVGGRLVLVGTPIGNLGDLSPRAVQALAAADLVCCEDTRRTGRLLQHAGIRAQALRVVNDHTEERAVHQVLDRLAMGQSVAIVSDAGMPGISDPGERLVRAALDAGYEVDVVPGPSAAITGLVASGLPAGRFVFEGFLPRKGSGRTARLRSVASEERTVVLYEAPHRVARTLADLVEVCGADRQVVLARELTKLHEELWRGSLGAAVAWTDEVDPRGEYVVVLEGAAEADEATDEAIMEALAAARTGGATTRDAVTEVVALLGVAKRRVYQLATGR
ncbi:MAG: 16S rRNA (cytidine(1402)-2'-O)-methyltransferase [Aquihabitans sp.]